MQQRKLAPFTKFLGPLGDEERGFSRGEAARNGAAVAALMEQPGWEVLTEMIDRCQRQEQLTLMRSTPGASSAQHERLIGQWNGMDQVRAIAEGIVAYGKQADADMESGAPAETQEAI